MHVVVQPTMNMSQNEDKCTRDLLSCPITSDKDLETQLQLLTEGQAYSSLTSPFTALNEIKEF